MRFLSALIFTNIYSILVDGQVVRTDTGSVPTLGRNVRIVINTHCVGLIIEVRLKCFCRLAPRAFYPKQYRR